MKTSDTYPRFVTLNLLVLALLSVSPSVAGDFEEPALLRSSDVLADKLREGSHHRVDKDVRSDGYINYYVLRSDYGDWEVASTPLLAVRVREVEALAALDDVSKTEVFIKAAADAGVGQLKAIKEFATQPVETITGIPKGIGRWFTRSKRDAEEAVAAAGEFLDGEDETGEGEAAPDDDSNVVMDLTEGYLGVSGAERAWAQELGTDPYTRNEVLRSAIKSVAWADRLGRFGMKFAPVPRIPGADVISEVNDVVWSKDPRELEDLNRERLAAMGADDGLIDEYLSNPLLTPTQLTYLTAALTEMDGVAGLDGIIRQALMATTEVEAGFFITSVTMLAWYHLNKQPVVSVSTEFAVPRAITEDGTAALVLATDYVFWTDTVATAADRFTALRDEDADRSLELWLLGDMSARTSEELTARNIQVHTNLVEVAD